MKIPLHYSLKVARSVVSKIDLPKNIAKHCTVDSWANCREQGLCISANVGNLNDWKKFVIAQQRNSDDILIVEGNYKMFDMQTNQPNDEVWEKGRAHFKYDQITNAVKFIENQIMAMVK